MAQQVKVLGLRYDDDLIKVYDTTTVCYLCGTKTCKTEGTDSNQYNSFIHI